MKHSKYPWDEFAATGLTKVHCLAFSARACETSVTDHLHPNKELDFFVSTTILINQSYLLTLSSN